MSVSRPTSSKVSPPELQVIGWQGVGKSTLARQIAEEIGGLYFDGDDAIPKKSWMKWQVEHGLPVFPPQVKDFMNNHFLPALQGKRKEAEEQNKPLVVSQGLFFNADRLTIQDSSRSSVYFLVINTSPELQQRQIAARCKAQNKSWLVTQCELISASKSNPYFEKPDPRLRAFTIDYSGRGSEKEFMKNFKSLSCYEDDFSRYKRSDNEGELSSRTIITSLSSKSLSSASSELKEQPSSAITSKRWVTGAAVVTLAAVGGAIFFARRLQNAAPEIVEAINSASPTFK